MRKKPTSEEVDSFLRAYGRKKRNSNWDPNDRHYSHQLEEVLKRMDPRELDALMRGEDDEALPTQDSDPEAAQ